MVDASRPHEQPAALPRGGGGACKDLNAVGELLAEEIVFHSPVTFHPFLGRETVRRLLGEVVQVFEDFRFTDELEMDDGAHALIFRATVAGSGLGHQISCAFAALDGLVEDFTVMLRPLSALVPFARRWASRARTRPACRRQSA